MNTVSEWATVPGHSFTKAGISNITLVFPVEILMMITKVQRFNNEADLIVISHEQTISYHRNALLFFPPVTIFIEIKNRFGATTEPCPVKVTVLPSFQRNSSSRLTPDQELCGHDGIKQEINSHVFV